jgi:hypothetical protein
MYAQRARFARVPRTPDVADQRVARDDGPPAEQQSFEQADLEGREVHGTHGSGSAARRQVDAQQTDIDRPTGSVDVHPATQQRSQAGQQLARAEGLGDVVVRPGVERRDALRFLVRAEAPPAGPARSADLRTRVWPSRSGRPRSSRMMSGRWWRASSSARSAVSMKLTRWPRR